MYRTLYAETPGGLQHAWYNSSKDESSRKNRSSALEKCQCMRFQYRYHLGWIKKIFGLIIIVISMGFLAWNERNAVESSRSFHEGIQSVTTLKDPYEIRAENQGKLVHVSGYLDIFDPLQDQSYGISIRAVKLKRRVQMYQWMEYDDNSFAGTGDDFENPYSSYRYAKVWKDKLIDSSTFEHQEHQNPKQFGVESQVRVNKNVQLGGFLLGPELKEKFNDFVQITSDERPYNQDIKMHMGLYYHSTDIWNPAVGDLRIQFSYAGRTDSFVSIIAKQTGSPPELRPYYTESGTHILFIHEGQKDHLQIFTKEHSAISMYCWLLRCVTWILSIFGTTMASTTIKLLNRRRSQIIQNIITVGPAKFSFVFATFLCLSTIAVVWFNHKPTFGILLLVFNILILYYTLLCSDELRQNSDYGYRKLRLPRYTFS